MVQQEEREKPQHRISWSQVWQSHAATSSEDHLFCFRSPSNESVTSPPAKGSKKEGKTGIVTGSLKISVTGLQSDKQGQGAAFCGTDLDIPYIEDATDSRTQKVNTCLLFGSSYSSPTPITGAGYHQACGPEEVEPG